MNKKFLKHYMETESEGTSKKYFFLVDNQDIAMNIVMSGYQALYLGQEDDGYYFSVNSFIEDMRSIRFHGTCQSVYHYVAACTTKWVNNRILEFCIEEKWQEESVQQLLPDAEEELRLFEKVSLEEEEKTVTFTLDERAFAYWNTQIHDWYAEEGSYQVMIGENADQMCLSEEILVHPTKEIPKVYFLNTCLGELMRDPKAQAVMAPFMQGMAQNDAATDMAEANANDQSGVVNQEMMAAMMEGMPLRQLLSFVPGIKREMLEQMVNALNQL